MSGQGAGPLKAAQDEVNRKFLDLVFQAAVLPTLCTKFQVMPTNADQTVLVLGGGIVMQGGDGSAHTSAGVISCVAFNRNFAADLALNLEILLKISSKDREEAIKRNPQLAEQIKDHEKNK